MVPLLNTKEGSQLVVVMTDRYSKLTKVNVTSLKIATTFACIFLKHMVAPYSTLFKLLTDVGPQFDLKFIETVFSTAGVKNTTTTEYLPHTTA